MKNDNVMTEDDDVPEIIEVKILKCVECDSRKFYYDDKLCEVSCLLCGLVLKAPYSSDFTSAGFKIDIEKKRINVKN